jgi:hypothetical protein
MDMHFHHRPLTTNHHLCSPEEEDEHQGRKGKSIHLSYQITPHLSHRPPLSRGEESPPSFAVRRRGVLGLGFHAGGRRRQCLPAVGAGPRRGASGPGSRSSATSSSPRSRDTHTGQPRYLLSI